MSIEKSFDAAFKRMKDRNWEKIYVLVDIHDTILKACYNDEVHSDILSFEKYLAEQKRDRENLEQLKFFLLNAIKYTDFEKILANVD